jgi:hypothetical protein
MLRGPYLGVRVQYATVETVSDVDVALSVNRYTARIGKALVEAIPLSKEAAGRRELLNDARGLVGYIDAVLSVNRDGRQVVKEARSFALSSPVDKRLARTGELLNAVTIALRREYIPLSVYRDSGGLDELAGVSALLPPRPQDFSARGQHLEAIITCVGDIQGAVGADGYPRRLLETTEAVSLLPPLRQHPALRR